MPLYSYKCSRCDTKFEELSTIENRDIPRACPDCGYFAGERQLDSTNFKVEGLNVHK